MLDDKWFFDNKYFKITKDGLCGTEKWRELLETCLRNNTVKTDELKSFSIITPEQLQEVIDSGQAKRNSRRSIDNNYYRRKIMAKE